MYFWIQLANILLGIFVSIFIRFTGLQFSFWNVFFWFWYESNDSHIRYIQACSFSSFLKYFGIVWDGWGLVLLYMISRIPLWHHQVLDFSLLRVYLLQFLFHYSQSANPACLFLPESTLVGYIFLEICPVLLGCPNCWHIMACNILMIFFFFVSL